MSAKKKVLLLNDVYNIGRSGDVSVVARGYANYLVWKGMALFADKATVQKQAKLQKERALKAAQELEVSKEIADRLSKITITIPVKVDQDGNMYGSVQPNDVSLMLEKQGIEVDKKRICMKAIKNTGIFSIKVKLQEGVDALFNLEVVPESKIEPEVRITEDK